MNNKKFSPNNFKKPEAIRKRTRSNTSPSFSGSKKKNNQPNSNNLNNETNESNESNSSPNKSIRSLSGTKSESNSSLNKSIESLSGTTSKSSCVPSSFSKFTSDDLLKLLKIDLEKLIGYQKLKTSELIDVKIAPTKLKEKIYGEIRTLIRCKGFPYYKMPEDSIKSFVEVYLSKIDEFIGEEENLPELPFVIGNQVAFKLQYSDIQANLNVDLQTAHELRSYLSRGFADLAIRKRKTDDDDDDKIHFLVAELKNSIIDSGIIQCVLYLISAYFSNKDGLPVYGICVDGEQCNLIKYSGDKNITIKSKFMISFPQMVEKNYKKEWLNNYSELVDIIYTIFKKYK